MEFGNSGFFFHLINRTQETKLTIRNWAKLELVVQILFMSALLFSTKHARTIVVTQLGKGSKPRLSEPEMGLLKY